MYKWYATPTGRDVVPQKYNKQKLKQKQIYGPDITVTQSQVTSISASLKNNGACTNKETTYTYDIHNQNDKKNALPSGYVNMIGLLAAPGTQGIPTYSTGKG